MLMGAPSIEYTRALTTTHYDARNRVDCIQQPLDAQGTVFSAEHDCMPWHHHLDRRDDRRHSAGHRRARVDRLTAFRPDNSRSALALGTALHTPFRPFPSA